MNVIFWSAFPGVSGVSSSMLSIALCTAAEYRIRCSVSQLHFGANGLLQPLIVTNEESAQFFENTGIGALIRATKGGAASTETVESCSFSFIEKKLNVFTKAKAVDEHIYENDLLSSIDKVFESLNGTFKVNFIDVPAGVNAYSKAAIKHADYVVICLPQSEWMINEFFDKFALPKEKVFYLFGNYDPLQYINVNNFSWKHKKEITRGRCAAIPHCTDFANHLNKSRAIAFFTQNLAAKPKDANFQYMRETKRATNSILRMCGVLKGGGNLNDAEFDN